MYLATLAHKDDQWVACLQPSPSSPSVAGLEVLFICAKPSGEVLRYAWLVDGDLFRALVGADAGAPIELLRRALARALRHERTLPQADGVSGQPPSPSGGIRSGERAWRWGRERRGLIAVRRSRLGGRRRDHPPEAPGAGNTEDE